MVVILYGQQIKTMSVDDLKNNMRRKDKAMLILDARNAEAFEKGHIPGAMNVFDPEIMSLAKDFDKNLNICVYGPGQASPSPGMMDRLAGDASKRLMDMGFKNVSVLNGGFEAWANSGNRVDATMRKMA